MAYHVGLSLDETDEDEDASGDSGWIPWFCGQKAHDFFVEVDEDYIRDNFNLYGLRGRFTYYDQALDMILGDVPESEDFAEQEYNDISKEAKRLYGLIHARFIVSPRGLQMMKDKYMKHSFGTCPRFYCGEIDKEQPMLPIGMSDECELSSVKLFCPRCEQVYVPKLKHGDVDGAFFGTSFPQIFLQSYPFLVVPDRPRPFVPRVFGFKLHKQKSLIDRKNEQDEQRALQQSGSSSAYATGAGASASPATQLSAATAAQQLPVGSGCGGNAAGVAAPAASAPAAGAAATRQQGHNAMGRNRQEGQEAAVQ